MIQSFYDTYAQLIGALANSRRLEIIHLLRDQELTVTKLYQMLDFPQANISQHLQVLRNHRIVTSRRCGKNIYYRLSHPHIQKACDLLHEAVRDQYGYKLSPHLSSVAPLVHDPVCGMQLSPKLTTFTASYQNQPYFFCASGCLKAFQQAPSKYVKVN